MATKTDYVLIGIGAFAAVLLTSYVPSLMKVMSLQKTKDEYATCPECKERANFLPPSIKDYANNPQLSLESIPGIDLVSLKIVTEKNLL